MSTSRPALIVGALVMLLATRPVMAQSVPITADVASPQAVPSVVRTPVAAAEKVAPSPVGPTTQRSVAGIRIDASASAEHAPAVAVARVGRNPAMMIVGGAALIVGAVIGGDAGTIVMVGGALVGLVGLWNYLR
jgi:hypothetical protein